MLVRRSLISHAPVEGIGRGMLRSSQTTTPEPRDRMRQTNAESPPTIASRFHNEVTAWVVLAVSLVITAIGWYISQTYVERRAADRFAYEVEDARQRILGRMLEYEQVLRGGVAMVASLGRPATRTEWHTFVSGLEIQRHFPGIQGVGYAVMLPPEQLAAHIDSVRAEGFDDYAVTPVGARDVYSAIVYLEPFDWRNRRAFGYDMYSNPMRRAAMDHARDTGLPAVSGRVTLMQETAKDVQAGFLVYLPVYRAGAPDETVEARRAALIGYVYSPFRMADLMRGILGGDTPDVGFVLHDGDSQNAETLLYASDTAVALDAAVRRQTATLSLPGRDWSATFYSTPRFEAAMSSRQPEMIAVGGLLVDVLLFMVIWSLGTERRRVEARAMAMTADIREATERLELAQDSAGIGTWEIDLTQGRVIWDARMLQLYGMDETQFFGRLTDWQRCVHPDDVTRVQAAIQAAITRGGVFDSVFRICLPDGRVRHVEAHGSAQVDPAGRPRRMVGVNRDITDQHEANAKIALAASVFDHAYEGIIITDEHQRIIDVNPAFTVVTGYRRDEVLGKTPALLQSGRHDAAFYAAMWAELKRMGFWRGEIWNRRKNGALYAQMETISAVPDGDGGTRRYIAVFSDITKMVEQQEKLERMAHYDALTGLPNRSLLADRLAQAMALARRTDTRLAVCYLDLDGFKPVNDRFGHAAGDQLLIQVADRLKSLLRDSDSVARLGGDEFVVLLNGIDDALACEHALERLSEGLKDTYTVSGSETAAVSASIGVTLYPMDDVDADTLLRHADHAMYFAKEQGRGRYHLFDAEQNRQMQAHRQTVSRISRAISAGEFVLHYQPKVDMREGRVVGAEALIRWAHPKRGLLPPAAFLPAVDDGDLAIPLGEWVIGDAMRQLSEWLRQGLQIKVSINISGAHLQQQDFAAHLEQHLRNHPEVPASLIELELLETTALDDVSKVSEIITQCRALGVSVSLDDFGTGYSSLTYLKQLPADTLKIDRSFVRDMLSDADDLTIVEGIVGLSRAFRRQVIAEGVESEDHGKLLLRVGCHLGQGYGIARPMPAEALPEWIRSYRQPVAWQQVSDMPWLRDDLPLYAAEFHHRQWLDQLVASLAPDTETTPPLKDDPALHRFAQWYAGEGQIRYGHLPEFAAIGPAHRRLYRLADALAQTHGVASGQDREALCADLLRASKAFLERLNALVAALGDGVPPAAPMAEALPATV
ncbi:MAG: EAL domain-containing protein [Denitromonas halophila]|nr:MAG: EAL domain-containing protein [Denitromonas halophila]TVT71445.1 MAG: EAL domain-containing protein [Denitromonas halophila]